MKTSEVIREFDLYLSDKIANTDLPVRFALAFLRSLPQEYSLINKLEQAIVESKSTKALQLKRFLEFVKEKGVGRKQLINDVVIQKEKTQYSPVALSFLKVKFPKQQHLSQWISLHYFLIESKNDQFDINEFLQRTQSDFGNRKYMAGLIYQFVVWLEDKSLIRVVEPLVPEKNLLKKLDGDRLCLFLDAVVIEKLALRLIFIEGLHSNDLTILTPDHIESTVICFDNKQIPVSKETCELLGGYIATFNIRKREPVFLNNKKRDFEIFIQRALRRIEFKGSTNDLRKLF